MAPFWSSRSNADPVSRPRLPARCRSAPAAARSASAPAAAQDGAQSAALGEHELGRVHMSAADHYSLGYTQPSVDQLGFEGEHGAAYTIQSRFREKQQRKMWNRNRLSSRAQNAIVSAATRRRKTTLQLSVRVPPTTLRGKVWVFFNEPSSSGGAYCWAILILTIIVFSCGVFVVQVSTPNRLLTTFFLEREGRMSPLGCVLTPILPLWPRRPRASTRGTRRASTPSSSAACWSSPSSSSAASGHARA